MLRNGLFLVLITISTVRHISTECPTGNKENYELVVNRSLQMEKEDYERLKAWREEFEVNMVDITTRYRMATVKQQRHYFREREDNEKWTLCLCRYQNVTVKPEQNYYLKENECLKQASSGPEVKRDAVSQIGRQIRNWRKTYKYLNNLCNAQFPYDSNNAECCLLEFMEKDNYIKALQRLIQLRIDLVQELNNVFQKTLYDLERCLQTQFSEFLDRVRSIMAILSKCYGVNSVVQPGSLE